jgi:hypothetical protein
MITRRRVYLELRADPVPEASHQLEREGWAVLRGAFSKDEVERLRADVERVYAELPADLRGERDPEENEDFRYEMLNRSALCQRVVADRRILDIVEPLLGEDCHVIANTAWRNPPRARNDHGGGHWHIDAGLLLDPCPPDCGPTAVLPGSHRSGQHPDFARLDDPDLRYEDRELVLLTGDAGDVGLFVSDVWHRRMPSPGRKGRFFLQVHYGRRDLAQRLRTTRDCHQLSDEALARATTKRERSVVGLHRPLFYDG